MFRRSALVLLAALICQPSCTDAQRTTRAFSGQALASGEGLAFTLECCTGVTLVPGLVKPAEPAPDLSIPNTVLKGHLWRCTAFGSHSDAGEIRVWCNDETGEMLALRLLDAGLATEDCTESANQFGTCGRN